MHKPMNRARRRFNQKRMFNKAVDIFLTNFAWSYIGTDGKLSLNDPLIHDWASRTANDLRKCSCFLCSGHKSEPSIKDIRDNPEYELWETEEELDFLRWLDYEFDGWNDYDDLLEEFPTDDQLEHWYYTLNDGTCIVIDSCEDDMYWDEECSYPCSATVGERLHALYLKREMEKVSLLKLANWI